MKWAAGLLLAATLASAASNDFKAKKSLSLFSVVTFPNDECQTNMNDMKGVCVSSEECSDNGGTASGNCASSFGVCCFYKVDDCKTTIKNNITYIQSPNFPTSFTEASQTCSYKVEGKSDVCSIRLDFESTTKLIGPDANGDCGTAQDKFSVSSPSASWLGFEHLCGTLTGQHMYITTGRENPAATININTGTSTSDRTWKIKVSMIECDCPTLPPEGCLQYFWGTVGKVTSFNGFHTDQQSIKNQDYDVCIRQEMGFCGFQVQQASTGTSPDAFVLDDGGTTAGVGTQCDKAWIRVQRSTETDDRFCDGILSSVNLDTEPGVVTSDVVPFRIGVVNVDDTQASSDGFAVIYRQTPC